MVNNEIAPNKPNHKDAKPLVCRPCLERYEYEFTKGVKIVR